MKWCSKRILVASAVMLAFATLAAPVALAAPMTIAASERPTFISVGEDTRPPIGWVQFCNDYRGECDATANPTLDVVFSAKVWAELARVNKWVNEHIKPMTDLEHWGVVERWDYPDDGYGDCEDYVLLKRKMLIKAGWPPSALLVTVVRDKKNEGHAVLTVKTDKDEFILDNQNEKIVAWTESGYKFVKRQSQSNPNSWVSLGEPPPTVATATAR